MTETISDYIARQARERQQQGAAAAGVVLSNTTGNPDEIAGNMKLATDWAKTTGKPQPPASMVQEYAPVFQQQIEERKNSTILASSPVLSEWLTNPDNAALARDDMENMSWFEASIRRGLLRVPQGVNQFMAFEAQRRQDDTSRSFSEILSDRTAIRDRDGRTVSQPLIPGPDDLFAAGSRFVQSRLADALGINSQDEAVAYQVAAGEVADRIASIPMTGPASEFRERLFGDIPDMPEDATFWDRTGSDLRRFAEVVGENPTGFVSFLTQVAVESFPLLAATGVVSATTRSPGAAAIFMGTSSGLTEAGVAPMEFFDEMGIDVSTPEGALAALTDPEILDAARQRGFLRGLMIGAFDGLSGGIAGQQLAATPVGNAVLQSISQAILGGLGEASAQIVSGQEFDINEVIIEALAEFVTAPIEVGSIRAGQFVQNYRSSRDAEDRRAVFEELSGQAVNSKLRARMPEAFRNFIERATQDGPVENVFVPADQFVQYFQSQGLDPYQVAESLTGVAQGDLDTALATGADLRIPTATYAAEMAGSPHDNFMFENMRLDPDQMTSAEARRFNEAMSDAMEEAYAEAERMRQTEERFKTFEAEIYDTMVSRLRAAGRSTDVATSEALLYPAFYRTMADRMGMGIDEFMQRYPLPQVQGDLPQGIQARNVDELTRTLAEARRFRESGAQEQDRRRTPLLEFISDYGGILDQGGELASRDAAVIQRGRGRRNLRLARDPSVTVSSASAEANRNFGADAVAQAAIEAGFMADNPLVLEYQEAMRTGREVPDITRALFDEIDRELSGQASMTQDRMVYGDETADDTMAALDEYLSRIGVSLDDDDAVIRAAIDRDQAEARMYGQDGRIDTNSEAFRRWFGDSVVVDADGEPRVMYHGGSFNENRDGAFQPGRSFGFFFSPDKRLAQSYAPGIGRDVPVTEAYLSLQNPFDPKNSDHVYGAQWVRDWINFWRDEDGWIDRRTGEEMSDSQVLQMIEDVRLYDYEENGMGVSQRWDDFLRTAQDHHDGFYGFDPTDGGVIAVAFSPTQIKSVNNRGTFDPSDPRILYQFAGPQSETADIHALANAKEMIEGGANPELVRQETGWFRGPDMKWRYEISDANARFVEARRAPEITVSQLRDGSFEALMGGVNVTAPTEAEARARMEAYAADRAGGQFDPNNIRDGSEFSLDQVLDHDRLFAAYPDLKMIPVRFDENLDALGQVNGFASQMTLNHKAFNSPDEMLSTLLHEVQHLIQRREGFARGGNAEMSGQVRDALRKLASFKEGEVRRFENENWMGFENAAEARNMVGYANMYQDFNRLLDYARMDRPSGVFRHIRNSTQWFYSNLIQDNDDLRARANDLQRSLYTLPRRGPRRNEFLRQFSFDLAQLLRDAVPSDRWRLLENDTRKTTSMIKAFEREASKASKKLKPHYELKKDARIARDQVEANQYRSPFEIYQLLAGEVEARNTQNRAAMTDAERLATPPAETMTRSNPLTGEPMPVTREDVIVVFQDFSVETPFMANIDAPEGSRFTQEVVGTVDVDGIDLPLNADGTVTLYHGTTADGASQIMQSGMLRSAAEPTVYLTTQTTAEPGYGDGTVVAVDVMPSMLRLDDEFPGGRADFAIDRSAVRVLRARMVDQRGRTYGQPAYHGTPHLFERFSLDKIGTGEGAQAFGWGLYFAGRKQVAEFYRDTLTRDGDPKSHWLFKGQPMRSASEAGLSNVGLDRARAEIRKDGGNAEATLSRLQERLDSGKVKAFAMSDFMSGLDAVRAVVSGDLTPAPAGRLFEVNIPEDSELLTWDAPLRDQPAEVLEKIAPLLDRFTPEDDALLAELGVEVTGEATGQNPVLEMTGQQFYEGLTDRFRSDRAASEALRDAGIPGHRYLDGGSRADGDGSFNYVIYDDSRIDVTRFEQEQRGSIQFPGGGIGNGDTVINLFRKADLSTFAHESGHFFLTVMQDMSERGFAEAQTEYQVIKDWWRTNAGEVAKDGMRVMPDITITDQDVIAALDNGTTGDALKDAAIDVGMQEQAARAFEAYLMEGKAPSVELRGIFDKFRAWLLSVYKSLRGLNVQPSDELRAVFDRMLATDEEIQRARAEVAQDDTVFTEAEQLGMTEEQFQAFLKLRSDAQAEASAKLLRETMEPIRRQSQQWYKDERQKVQAEVEREVNAYRHYRALEWMGNRRWLGEDKPESLSDMRMSKDMLVERFGAGVLDTLPRGRQTIYAVEGGVDPEVAADLFGFSSADEMIRALERAPSRKEAIQAETDRVMNERHMDPLVDGTVQEKALEAIHGDKRAQALEVELKALTEIAGSDRGITRQEARQIARRTLSRSQVRDAMAAQRYLAAERKAATEVERLAGSVTRTKMWADAARRKAGVTARAAVREGDAAAVDRVAGQIEQANTRAMRANADVQALIEAKRRQLMNHMLYNEARKIGDEVEAAENLARRLQRKSTRDKLAGDYLEAIDELLGRYDFRKISRSAEDRRGALLAYVERMTAEGRENELSIPESVLRDANRTPYKRLTVEELRGVVDSLKNIEHTARLKRTLQDAQSKRELDAVVEEIETAFDKNIRGRAPGRVGSAAEKRGQSVRAFLDLVLNAGTLLREIDGFEDFGPAFRNIKAPIDAAMNRLQERRMKAADDLAGLYDAAYTRPEQRQMNTREYIPEIETSLSKWERLAVALNMGNDGNYQRLTDTRVRGGFTEDQVQAIIRTLDERDARFVQSVWDYIGSFWPDIEARERRVSGVAPKRVDPRPVEIGGVTLKGGYYPLKYDPRLSAAARDDQMQDISKSLQAGRFGKAQTSNGHLKERAQASGRGVELDMSVLHQHVQRVVYDLELSEPVANSWRILQDGRVRNRFIEAGKQADFDALELWLKDVAEGEIRAADWVSRQARRFKSNFTAAKLALNLSTVAVQLTGVAQSMVVTGKKEFVSGVVQSFRPGVVDDISAKSAFMRERQTTFNKDIFDLYNDPKMGPTMGRWTQVRNEWIAPAGLWLMTKVQFYAVDLPTWLASYEKGLKQFGNDEGRAVAFADDVVKRTQASGLFSDRSAIERGALNMRNRQNDLLRLFTTLGSYMFAKFNVAYERTGRARNVIREEGFSLKSFQEAMSWAIDMAFLFTLEAILYAAIKGRLPDDDDEDDDWASFLVRETALSIASTIPFVRDGASVYSGFESGGSYGGIISELTRPIIQAEQGEFDRPFVKSVINATGLFTGLPTGQINRAVDAGWRAAEGEDVSPAEYLLGRMGN